MKEFVETTSGKLGPKTELEKRRALIETFCDLILDIAGHIDELQPRERRAAVPAVVRIIASPAGEEG